MLSCSLYYFLSGNVVSQPSGTLFLQDIFEGIQDYTMNNTHHRQSDTAKTKKRCTSFVRVYGQCFFLDKSFIPSIQTTCYRVTFYKISKTGASNTLQSFSRKMIYYSLMIYCSQKLILM